MPFVYVFGAAGTQLVKIGRANDVRQRLSDCQTGSPLILAVLWSRETDYASLAESTLHQRFAKHRAHGEWFSLGADPLSLIIPAYNEMEGTFEEEVAPALASSAVDSVERVIRHAAEVCRHNTGFRVASKMLADRLMHEYPRVYRHMSQHEIHRLLTSAFGPATAANLEDGRCKTYLISHILQLNQDLTWSSGKVYEF